MDSGDPSAKQTVAPRPEQSNNGNSQTSELLPYEQTVTQHALLGEMRVEIQALQNLFENVRKGMASFNDYKDWMKSRKDHIDALLKAAEHYQGGQQDDVGPAAESRFYRMFTSLVGRAPATGKNQPVAPVIPESLCYLRALWEELKACRLMMNPDIVKSDPQQLQQQLSLLEDLCGKLVFKIGYEVIPDEINGWLKTGWPGYYVSFHTAFNDELPDQGDRVKMLNYFAEQPRTIKGGIVDVGTGLIYNYSRSYAWQFVTAVGVAGAFLGTGVALYYLAGVIGQVMSLPPQNTISPGMQLLTLWVAILAGVVLHIVVATAKLIKNQPGHPPVLAFTTLFPLINAKLGRILFKLLITLVGLFGLLFATKTPVTMLNAFLAGYSIDSIVELFATSAEQQATAYVTTVQKDLGVATP